MKNRRLRITTPVMFALLFGACASSQKCPTPKSAPASAPVMAKAVLQEAPAPQSSHLSSWKKGPTKQKIVDFVQASTNPKSELFVPKDERIAVFDNDGTLWVESPMYTQLIFAMDRIRELSAQHPEWKNEQPFKAILENDTRAMGQFGKKDLLAIVMASHAGTSSEEFQGIVADWLEKSEHPTLKRPYQRLIYQPMLEMLDYLREAGFKTYIVSGGGVDFMRVFAQEAYGIPPEQVIGSALAGEYDAEASGGPVVRRKDEMLNIDDGPGKPISIDRIIGRRPTIAVGNSDGDYEMIDWSTAGKGARLGIFVHHTDSEREAAYDRESHVGKLARGLDDAKEKGWLIIDMKEDWLEVFPKE